MGTYRNHSLTGVIYNLYSGVIMAVQSKLESLIKHGLQAKGLQGIKKLLKGVRNTRQEAIEAKCYDCMGGYADGVVDCGDSSCPIYPYNPYKGRKCGKTSQK